MVCTELVRLLLELLGADLSVCEVEEQQEDPSTDVSRVELTIGYLKFGFQKDVSSPVSLYSLISVAGLEISLSTINFFPSFLTS